MKNRFKASILWIMALAIASLISTGSVLAEIKTDQPLTRTPPNTGEYEIKVEEDTPEEFVKDNRKCFKFEVVDQSGCPSQPNFSTVVIQYNPDDNTFKNLKAMNGNKPCEEVFALDQPVTPHTAPIITYFGDVVQTLTGYVVADTKISEIWFRFTTPDGCNVRCYGSGGNRVCW